MKKNILILGPSRAGKTTLTKKLNEELNYSIVCFDSLICAFEESFPQLGICHGSGAEKTAANFAGFLSHYIRELSYCSNHKNGIKFAAEGGYFDLDNIMFALNGYDVVKDIIFIGLVYNNKTPDQLFREIRENDTEEDWSYNCDDETLKRCASLFIEDSRSLYQQYQKHNFMIYDVSNNREQVLNEVVDEIKKSILCELDV